MNQSLSSQVQIRAENTNDETPYFIPTRQYTSFVAEDAEGSTPITTVQVLENIEKTENVQALDDDGDMVTYAFLENGEETLTTTFFEIDKDTGE